MDIKENIKIWSFLMLVVALVTGSVFIFSPLTLQIALGVVGVVTVTWFVVSLILGPLFIWWMGV